MSFISEALRKSEQRRNEQRELASVDRTFATVSRSSTSQSQRRLLILVLLALVVVGVLLALVVVKEFKSTPAATAPVTHLADTPVNPPQPAATRPLADEPSDAPVATDELTAAPPPLPAFNSDDPKAVQPEAPSQRHLGTSGLNGLQELTLQLLVYHKETTKRFAIINGQHVTEGQALKEGPTVEQITPNGVLLNYQGTRFQLP
jgi:general secretion pathway protein B